MRTGPARQDRCTISAIFPSPEAVDETLYRLELLGTPRDLVEVVVSEEISRRMYGGTAKRRGSRAVAFAGAGALVGLVVGILVSLAAVGWPGQDLPVAAFWAQLVGPNAGTALGAVIGGLYGALRKRPPHPGLARAPAADGPVLAVRHWPIADVDRIAEVLRAGGGRDVHVDTGRST